MATRSTIKKWRLFFTVCLFLALAILIGCVYVYIRHSEEGDYMKAPSQVTKISSYANSTVSPQALPTQVILNDNYYVPQTFNNCGPAALSMDLSYYGVDVSQEILADALRPDHNATGHDDDKSTPPEEIAAQAQQYGLIAYYRPAGTITLLKQLVAAGFPVMTRTLFMQNDKVAHYRVIKGYNDVTGTIIEEDGFQGPNVSYTYTNFLALWKYFNYEYIVLAPPSKQAELKMILGPDADASTAWQQAAQNAQNDLEKNPTDILAQFNLSVADYYMGNYAQAAAHFENVQLSPALPPDTLWYQMEPIETYYELGDYDKVFSLSQYIFDNGNPAYPELYVLRGESYLRQGDPQAAKAEFEKALFYNKNLQSAKEALATLGNAI